MFVRITLSAKSRYLFSITLKKPMKSTSHNTRHTSRNTVELPQPMTESYGRYSGSLPSSNYFEQFAKHLPIDMLSENYSI